MKHTYSKLAFALAIVTSASAHAGVITAYSDLTSFNTAVGALAVTVETFTNTFHFPISSGVLNSATNEAGITPGTIQPGVTYSTPVGGGLFFNIDASGGFTGGFLDTVTGNNRVLTIAFDNDVQYFAFDSNDLVGTNGMSMTVNFASGSPFQQQIVPANGNEMDFFGFGSDAADIASITLSGSDSTFSFAIDNFRFTAGSNNQSGSVPEPATLALMGMGLVGLGAMRRRKTH